MGFVASPRQIAADMPRRRSAPKAKIPLSGGSQSFFNGLLAQASSHLTENIKEPIEES